LGHPLPETVVYYESIKRELKIRWYTVLLLLFIVNRESEVARQNKLEIPNDEEEVNTREIHKCDGQAHDPDTTFTVERKP
jgi:hypothetical protein